jgi:hypothetical protein
MAGAVVERSYSKTSRPMPWLLLFLVLAGYSNHISANKWFSPAPVSFQ